MKKSLIAALLLAVIAAAVYAQDAGLPFISSSQATYKLLGSPEPIQLYRNIGHPTLVLFWASWCLPCVAEVPQINYLHATYAAAGLNILAMNLDEKMTEEALKALVKRFEIIYPVAAPSPELVNDFHVRAVPATFLYAPDGRLVGSWLGPTTAEAIEKYLTKLLPAKAAKPEKDTPKP
jgi:thiol-disulfide isomerase/thioredoxin